VLKQMKNPADSAAMVEGSYPWHTDCSLFRG
jgi:hypothetical protein